MEVRVQEPLHVVVDVDGDIEIGSLGDLRCLVVAMEREKVETNK